MLHSQIFTIYLMVNILRGILLLLSSITYANNHLIFRNSLMKWSQICLAFITLFVVVVLAGAPKIEPIAIESLSDANAKDLEKHFEDTEWILMLYPTKSAMYSF